MWQSMRSFLSKILEGWTRAIYEKVKVWDSKKTNHKKLER